MGVASIPLDRFFGMTTSSHNEPGFILTRTILLNRPELELNAKPFPGRNRLRSPWRIWQEKNGWDLGSLIVVRLLAMTWDISHLRTAEGLLPVYPSSRRS
jgi:hypothetical protein